MYSSAILKRHSYPVKQWVVENADALKEHFEVRLLIEPHAAALACRFAEPKDLEALKTSYASFVEKVKTGNVIEAICSDSAFHLAVAKATKNRTLAVLMKTMDQTLNEGWYASLHAPGRLHSSIEEHGRLLQAILDHDPEAAALGNGNPSQQCSQRHPTLFRNIVIFIFDKQA